MLHTLINWMHYYNYHTLGALSQLTLFVCRIVHAERDQLRLCCSATIKEALSCVVLNAIDYAVNLNRLLSIRLGE